MLHEPLDLDETVLGGVDGDMRADQGDPAAEAVPGVLAVEKLFVRKMGLGYRATIHVQADPAMSLEDVLAKCEAEG